MNNLEEGTEPAIDFGRLAKFGERGQQVVPVAIQNADTLQMLYVGYANERALRETLRTRRVVLWSTSRNELWRKGETSGDVLNLVDVRVNCEQNSLLYLVRPTRAGACHTRDSSGNTRPTCYYRRVTIDGDALGLEHLG
jgi:phosphoribosyl-AMP cyclohydrolase